MDADISNFQVSVVSSEDSPMLKAIDREMGGADLLELRPTILPVDKGAIQVRRITTQLVNAEKKATDAQMESA